MDHGRLFSSCGVRAAVALLCLYGLTGCDYFDPMANQPRCKPLRESPQFSDGTSARPLVAGTVAWRGDPRFSPVPPPSPAASGPMPSGFPFALTLVDLHRGQERFMIFCSPCHGQTGEGDGMSVQRGFTRPPSFHSDRLRSVPPQHVVDVITHGYGAMYSYNERVEPDDRWRIAAYIRALQLSQHARVAELSAEDRRNLERESVPP